MGTRKEVDFYWWKYSRNSETENGELNLRYCFPWKFEVLFKSDHLWFLQKNFNEWKTSSLITNLLYISSGDLNKHLCIVYPFNLNFIFLFLACLIGLSPSTKDHRSTCRERGFFSPKHWNYLLIMFELWLLSLPLNFCLRVSGKPLFLMIIFFCNFWDLQLLTRFCLTEQVVITSSQLPLE